MQFKGVKNLAVAAKGQRGLAYKSEYLEALPLAIGIVAEAAPVGGVNIKAGQPTSVLVTLTGVPINADVKTITAELHVGGFRTTGPNRESAVTVKEDDKTAKSYGIGVAVDMPPGLQNVELKLDQGETFWTRAGALVPGIHEIPDFAAQTNAYLETVKTTGGDVTLNFLVKSDTDGRALIRIKNQDYALLQTQAWKNDLDATLHLDRSIALGFGDIEAIDLDAIPVPANKRIKRMSLKLDAGGEFGPVRLLGPTEVHDGVDFATIGTEYSVAARIRLVEPIVKQPVSVNGIAVYLESAPAPGVTTGAPTAAELYVEVQPDEGGVPASVAPLAKGRFAFTPTEPGARQRWTRAPFEAAVELKPDTPYWIVLKGVTGLARAGLYVRAGAGPAPVVCERAATHRGGQTWRLLEARQIDARPPEVLLAPLYVPGIDNRTAAIEFSVDGAATTLRLDPGADAQTATLPLPADDRPRARIVARSYAAGTLTIANVIQEYRLE